MTLLITTKIQKQMDTKVYILHLGGEYAGNGSVYRLLPQKVSTWRLDISTSEMRAAKIYY
jgi:hypothetical protein